MTKLHQLPNGSWVRPETVTAIVPLPSDTGFLGMTHRARVVVHHNQGCTEVILANDNDHASELASEIANQINS